jgi:cytoskeletal protein CcmA (bactofilin family)
MAKADMISTFLGQGAELEGKLKVTGTLRLDGHFKGEISVAGTLIVGEGANIESDIHVSNLLNSGEIRGKVIADEKIEIRAGGKVIGSIQTPALVMDEGGIIEGECRMHETEEKDEKKLTVFNSGESVTEV